MELRHINVNNTSRHIRGWHRDRPDHRDLHFEASGGIPIRADVRSICPNIEDQGDLGSCTANSSTSAMEALYLKAKKPNPQLSRLYLYWSTRTRVEGTPATEDSGCEIRNVMKALAKFGTCVEKVWPYDVSKFADTPNPAADADAMHHQILRYYRATGLPAIMRSIAEGYPVVGGFSVPENMESDECARTGLVRFPSTDEKMIGGHAVLFVGFDQRSKELIFANSWGTSWGRKGFGYLPFEFVTHGLADDFWTIRTEEF